MPKILTSISTWNNGEFAVKMFNAIKEAKMVSQKLAMVRVHLYEGCKITWDTQMAEVKVKKVIEFSRIHFVNQITLRS